MSNKKEYIIEVLIIIILFVLFSYVVQTNVDVIKNFMKGNDSLGMLIYVIITIIAIVIAPISTFTLFSVASNLWGCFIAAI